MNAREIAIWLARATIVVLSGVVLGLLAAFAFITLAWLSTAHAGEATVRIPEVSTTYRVRIQQEAVRYFGLDAPVARLAAQVHQESGWRAQAASAYAHGLAQFTPQTARWLPTICPAVGDPDPWDPHWSLRAQACYMAWLYARVVVFRHAGPMAECSRWAFALREYNGGERWLLRERLLAQQHGANANDWQAVAPHRARAEWAHRENVHYPQRILLRLEPAYLAAGWPGVAVCP